jgi:hypothetical protein
MDDLLPFAIGLVVGIVLGGAVACFLVWRSFGGYVR